MADTVDLLVRLPADLHAQVKARAEAEERSIAGTTRLALRLYLARPSELDGPPSNSTNGQQASVPGARL